ncbi:MAG: HEPN domain-containing protein [Candidatus Aenigmatarchaeota archaeon]
MKEETKELIEIANSHLNSAKNSFKIEDYKSTCFWAQQSIELFIKAYMVEKGIFNPKRHKTHNLRILISDCAKIDEDFKQFLIDEIDMIALYASLSRYDIKFIKDIEKNKRKAEISIEIAEKVKEFVLNKLKEKLE